MIGRVTGPTLRGIHETELFGKKLKLRANLGACMAIEDRLGPGRSFGTIAGLFPMGALGVPVTVAVITLQELAKAGGTPIEDGFLEDSLLGDVGPIYEAVTDSLIASGFLETRSADEAPPNEKDGVPEDPTLTGFRAAGGSD